MATIVTRAGKGSPLTSSELDQNQINLNTDKAELSGATFTGEITANGGIALGDNDKATFGDSDDLEIYHDGSNSYIKDVGTGSLKIQGVNLNLQSTSGESYIDCVNDGTVYVYHNNALKLATTSTGIDVTGTATVDGLVVDTSATGGLKVEDRGSSGTSITSYQGTTNANVRQLDLKGYKVSINTGAVTGTTVSERLLVAENGDISFYEDTGTTPKFFWDASAEALGIGTDSPDTNLMIHGGDTDTSINVNTGNGGSYPKYTGISFGATSTSLGGDLQFRGGAGVQAINTAASGNVTDLRFWTTQGGSPAERMRIDSSGDLNIVNTGQASLNYTTDGSSDYARITGGKSGSGVGDLRFFTYSGGIAERMRIDSSGNLLVGTTSALGSSGTTLSSDGYVYASNDNAALYLNRQGIDGDIAEFRKGGTTVGSIGAKGGTAYLIGSSKGLRVSGSGLIPITTAGANSDATYDIGDPSVRFKDLYLSSGVYLGGTGAANKLDDYEEGTWSPTGVGLTLGSPAGTYTKVGRLVTVNWLFVYPTTSSGSQTSIAGLPFTVGTGYTNGGNHGYVNGSAAVSIAHITAVTTSLLYRTANGGVALTHADLSGATIRGSMTYMTA